EHRTDRLVSQAHAKNRHGLAELLNHCHRDAGILRTARSRRNDNSIRTGLDDVGERHRIVAHDEHVSAELAQILNEVVGKRIVVVDDAHHAYSPACASSSARNSAFALSRVSSYSAAGFESITIPAPACT